MYTKYIGLYTCSQRDAYKLAKSSEVTLGVGEMSTSSELFEPKPALC